MLKKYSITLLERKSQKLPLQLKQKIDKICFRRLTINSCLKFDVNKISPISDKVIFGERLLFFVGNSNSVFHHY